MCPISAGFCMRFPEELDFTILGLLEESTKCQIPKCSLHDNREFLPATTKEYAGG